MNNKIKTALRIFRVKLILILLTVFCLVAFSWLVAMKYGILIYTCLTSAIYLMWVYNEMHDEGARNTRDNIYKPVNGLITGALSELPSVVFLAAVLLSGKNFTLFNSIYALWQAPYFGFLLPHGALLEATSINFMYFAVIFIVPLLSFISYIAGSAGLKKQRNAKEKNT